MEPFRYILFSLFLMTSSSQSTTDNFLIPNTKVRSNSRKIVLLPLGKVSKMFIDETVARLKSYIPTIELRKAESMPSSAYYKPRNRYRADKLLSWLQNRTAQNETWVGITMNDISTTKGIYYDYGVMGLGRCPGSTCVASNFRLKQKKYFYKVVIHELGHTTGLPHCSVKTCFMTDADGGDPTATETDFCVKCTRHLINQGWSLK